MAGEEWSMKEKHWAPRWARFGRLVVISIDYAFRDANHINILSGRIGFRIREVFIKCVQFDKFNGSSHSKNQGGIQTCRRTWPVSFRGAEVSCPNILSIACPKIKWFCPNITWFFNPNMAIWKILGGAAAPPSPPPPPRTPMEALKFVQRFTKKIIQFSGRLGISADSGRFRQKLMPPKKEKKKKEQVPFALLLFISVTFSSPIPLSLH